MNKMRAGPATGLVAAVAIALCFPEGEAAAGEDKKAPKNADAQREKKPANDKDAPRQKSAGQKKTADRAKEAEKNKEAEQVKKAREKYRVEKTKSADRTEAGKGNEKEKGQKPDRDQLKPRVCITHRTEARFMGVGFDHLVFLSNECDARMLCLVTTNVNPEAQKVELEPFEKKPVLTFRGSPAMKFKADVRCQSKKKPEPHGSP